MAITMVNYQKVYSVGPYISERIGLEASVDEGQDPKFILAELKKLADEVNQANNPHLFPETSGPHDYLLDLIGNNDIPLTGTITTGGEFPQPKVQAETIPKKQADMIASIMGGTTYNEVKLYEKLAAKYPAVLEAYNEKLKQFT